MRHVPVMPEESLRAFRGKKISVFFDGTLGAGGFAKLFLSEHPEVKIYIGCDRDVEALETARRYMGEEEHRVVFVHGNFGDLEAGVRNCNITDAIDGFFLISEYHQCSWIKENGGLVS